MQVELNIALELPDEFASLTPEELRQVLYDEYVSAISGHHAAAAVEWCARGRVGSSNEDPVARRIYENHSRWHKITSRPHWTLAVKPESKETEQGLKWRENLGSNNKRRLDEPAIDCPICGEGKAALFEESRTGKVREFKAEGPVEASYCSRFRVCDHCESEFAGLEESRYNVVQYKAMLAEHGPVVFPSK